MAQKFFQLIRARFFNTVADTAIDVGVKDEVHPRFAIDAGGKVLWGNGSTALDTNLYRSATNTLKTDNAFVASNGVIGLTSSGAPSTSIADGAFAVDTTNSKFYFRSGGTWVEAGSGSIIVGDTPPASPVTGNLWYESDTGKLFIRYDSFWVEISSVGPQGPQGPPGNVDETRIFSLMLMGA